MKMDESVLEENIIKDKEEEVNVERDEGKQEKRSKSDGTIQIGSFRKRKKSGMMNETRFL